MREARWARWQWTAATGSLGCGAGESRGGKGSRGERGEVQHGARSLRGARMGPGKEEAGRELATGERARVDTPLPTGRG